MNSPHTEPRAEDAARDDVADHQQHVFQLLFGHVGSKAVHVAVRLRIPEILGDHAMSVEELAERSGAQPATLARLLRALGIFGLTRRTGDGHVALTDSGALLRPDVPGSVQGEVLLFADESVWQAWNGLEDAIRDGKPAFDRIFGCDFYTHLCRHPALEAVFNQGFARQAREFGRQVADIYDFSRVRTVVDVGGGDGVFLTEILARHRHLHGVLADLRAEAETTRDTVRDAGVEARCTLTTCDFLSSVPSGGDLYVTRNVIRDWGDETATTILRNCRRDLRSGGRLLLVEPVCVETPLPSARQAAEDLLGLVLTGGRLRTENEYRTILTRAGWTLDRVTPLESSDYHILEASPSPED
ncbi:dimerization domain-containing protein [Streptoalloteichus tenebrarius]|uniref:Dimerization domain-containing protein n=1 Tax=Streptoalloteichus tenebrarius (strain ATCC 17920 / DSM 40477 / JCM 4838 / CBS 697.72 / NBRC 16177 / NCIMB 11028 / NRRL B-12390 / A12253. 1 / ISP 5477) TaxID=1933 RepID=A0ABT1HPK2_STRSD|nr:acetylserotonin O-methyltransferase [Streptoalloteichus tenebrarius]MCP2257405.1 dimerization domain-containing protein [Streptoalloteichus tenebrarius]BFE98352.1 methyltransferase [Streptoalloteichus tenebrarius]